MENYKEPKEKMKDVASYPIMEWKERGIRKETMERFGIRCAVSPENGKDIVAIYYPYYDQKSKLCGYKKKDLTLDKNDRGHFTAIGKVGVECKMFGQEVAEQVNRKHSNIFLVEGETEVLSVFQCMKDSVKNNTTYSHIEPFVVSISCGTKNAVDSVMHNVEYIKSFDSCTFAFDNDYSTEEDKRKGIVRGKEATDYCAAALMGEGLEMFVIPFPYEYKDPSDMLQDGKDAELARLFSFGKKPYSAEKIVSATDIGLDEIMAERPEGVYTQVFPKLDRKLHGFRVKELVVLTAPSNAGKSLVTNEIMYRFLEAGEVCGYICLEEGTKETIQRIIAKRCGVNYNRFKENPLGVTTKEKIEEAYKWLTEERSAYFLDHFGSLQINDLMNKIKSFVFANKVRYLLVDHLSMIFSGSLEENERRQVDLLMTHLAAFCAANEVCIIAVSHLNRSIAIDFKPPKAKDGKEPESWWVPVTKEAMRSSSSLEQLSWTVLGLEPQVLITKERGHVRLTVLKNRTHGSLGICDEFIIDDNTGEVVLFNEGYGGF